MRLFPSISTWFMAALVAVGLGWTAVGGEAPGDWRQWQQERRESVAGTNGWATVVGLFWLHEGTNSVGASVASEIGLPAGASPEIAGRFIRQGTQVRFEAGPGVVARVAGQPIEGITLSAVGEVVESGLWLEEGGIRRGLAVTGYEHRLE